MSRYLLIVSRLIKKVEIPIVVKFLTKYFKPDFTLTLQLKEGRIMHLRKIAPIANFVSTRCNFAKKQTLFSFESSSKVHMSVHLPVCLSVSTNIFLSFQINQISINDDSNQYQNNINDDCSIHPVLVKIITSSVHGIRAKWTTTFKINE